MLLSVRQCNFTHHLALLILECDKLGFDVKIHELNRLVVTQREYVNCGKSKTMKSKHLDNLAADIVLFKNGELCKPQDYKALGVFWESLGNRWGGRFGLEKSQYASEMGWDHPHFELGEIEC